jgi:hypothetical protein
MIRFYIYTSGAILGVTVLALALIFVKRIDDWFYRITYRKNTGIMGDWK